MAGSEHEGVHLVQIGVDEQNRPLYVLAAAPAEEVDPVPVQVDEPQLSPRVAALVRLIANEPVDPPRTMDEFNRLLASDRRKKERDAPRWQRLRDYFAAVASGAEVPSPWMTAHTREER